MASDLEATYGYLQALVDRDWQIKGSLETRSSSLLAILIAALAASFAVVSLTGAKSHLTQGAPLALSVASLAMLAITLVAAVVVNLPVNYPAIKEEDLRELLTLVESSTPATGPASRAHLAEMADSLIDDLRIVRAKNQLKGWSLAAGTVSFGVSVLLFVIGLLLSIR